MPGFSRPDSCQYIPQIYRNAVSSGHVFDVKTNEEDKFSAPSSPGVVVLMDQII